MGIEDKNVNNNNKSINKPDEIKHIMGADPSIRKKPIILKDIDVLIFDICIQ